MYRSKILFGFIACILIINSCTKGGADVTGGDPDEAETVALAKKSAKPYQLINVVLEDESLSAQRYTGQFNGEEMELVKADDTTLVFLAPDLPEGTYPAEFAIGAVNYEFDIEILEEETIADAKEYVDDFFSGMLADTEYEITPEMQQALQGFEKLSAEDKMIAARFIDNNRGPIDELEQEVNAYFELAGQDKKLKGQGYKTTVKACDFYCKAAQLAKIAAAGILLPQGTALIGTIAAIGIGIDIGLSILTGKRSYLLSKVKSIASEVLSWVYFPQTKLAELVFSSEDFNELLLAFKSDKQKSNTLELEEGISYNIYVADIPFRTLNAEDAGSSNSTISTLVEAYDTIREKAKEYFDFELPGYNDKVETKPLESMDRIAFSVAGSNVEISELTTEEDHFKLKFDLVDENTSELQNFNLNVTYSDDTVTTEHSLDLALKKRVFIYEGVWLMTTYFDDGSVWQYDRITFDAEGNSIKEEYNIPNNNSDWGPSGYTYKMYYDGFLNIDVLSLTYSFYVNSFDQVQFNSVETIPNGSPRKILKRES